MFTASMLLLFLLRLGRKLFDDVVGVFPSQRNVFGVASPCEDLSLVVAEVDGRESECFADCVM